MAARTDVVCLTSGNHIYYIIRPEPLAHSCNCFKHGKKFIGGFNPVFRMQAVVAKAAVVLMVFFAEIMEKNLPPAYRRLRVALNLGRS